MAVLFLTTRKTHADDLAATLAHAGLTGFKNYELKQFLPISRNWLHF